MIKYKNARDIKISGFKKIGGRNGFDGEVEAHGAGREGTRKNPTLK